jgi:hypothetical protein
VFYYDDHDGHDHGGGGDVDEYLNDVFCASHSVWLERLTLE